MPSVAPADGPPCVTTRGRLLLVRHGESALNAADCFTGRLDVPLTPAGAAQARQAARLVAASGYPVGAVLTSPMLRARQTAEIIAAELQVPADHVETAVELVERDYGVLTGMPRAQALAQLGPTEYTRLRRTLEGAPPRAAPWELPSGWTTYEAPGVLARAGSGEPLTAVVSRLRPWWQATLRMLQAGATLLVVAHGNSLRALCLVIDHLSAAEVEALNLPTAQPLMYRIRDGHAEPRGGEYLDAHHAHSQAARLAEAGGT